jgi:methylmalonyl-CoA mutase
MAPEHTLFDAFAPVSKEEWLKKIEKELKGQPLESLDWALQGGLRASPFAHREDWPFETPPLPAERLNNDWEIGEEIPVHTIHEARQLALEAIENGVQAPRWTLKRPLRLHEWQELLGGIDMALVSTHIAGIQKAEDFPAIWKTFFEMVQSHPQRLSLRGSIYIHGIAYAEEGFAREMAPLLERGAMALPGFRLLTVNGHLDFKGPEGVVDELTGILARGASIMDRYTSLGLAPDRVHHHIQLSVAVGTAYFLEIAKIRALKLLWAHLMDAYGITNLSLPPIDVRFAPASQTADPHQNMIRAATQAMSAVIAGVDRLTVQPAEDTAFGRRIARNVQHLLKMESYLDRVIDPAAGSYYIEKLTDALAEKAWGLFQTIR